VEDEEARIALQRIVHDETDHIKDLSRLGDKVISRAEIETNQDIPSHYLSKIMKDLVASGLVHSHVGSKGGFSLARSAETISIKEVYETVERPIVLMECLDKSDERCPYGSVCTQISVSDRAQSLLANYLSSVTVGNIADQTGLRGRYITLHG
jgi:Rrf2 family protein